MADDDYTDDIEEDEDGSRWARVPVEQLRSLQKKGKTAEAGAKAMRELAFVKAGVDTDSKTGKLVMAAYDGELTTEAIVAFAAEIPGALVAAEAPGPANPPLEEGEAASTDERNALAEGATSVESSTPDPRRAAVEAAQADYKAGATEADVLAGYVKRVADSAASGDGRVLVHRQ